MDETLSFGRWMKVRRVALGLTQARLAERTGYATATIRKIESDDLRPSQQIAERLAEALALAPEEQAAFLRRGRGETSALGQSAADRLSLDPNLPVKPSPAHLQLPPQATPLIGREAELAQVEQLLANPDCRLLTLLGVGGIGKTRLAIEAAACQASHFTDGVCFVALAPVVSTDFVLLAIAQSLGVQLSGGDLVAELAASMRSRQLLLVLDNFEHLLEASESVAHLLHGAPRLKVLVTSRERLALREEWLLPVAGLSLEAGLAGEAAQLFVRSAQRVQPGFAGEGQETAIAAICRQVEGMPLAIELAASWVRVMSCAEIARQMETSLDFLSSRVRNLPERHRSLRALFDHSWRLLSPVEQGVLRRLSTFQGGWHVEQAAEVAGATLALLLGLVDKSLVQASGQNRFDLHELVRQYGAEQLAASDESNLLRERHYAVYLQLFRTGDAYSRGPEAATWIGRMTAEQDNLRAALQWALDEARYADVAWLLIAAEWFWFQGGYWYEGGRWLMQLLPHRQALTPDLRLAIVSSVNALGNGEEDLQPVVRYTDEVIQLIAVCQDKLLQVAGWYFIGCDVADFSQAGVAFERAIALARQAGESPGLGPEFCWFSDRDFVLCALLITFAARLIERGEFARAAPLLLEGHTLSQERGIHYLRADSLGALGRLAFLQGDLAQAHRLLAEVVSLAADLTYQQVTGERQPLLGLVVLYRGDAVEARRLLIESLRLCLELRDKLFLARVCSYLAELELWEGALDQAAHWLAQSLAYQADPNWITIDQVERLWVAARLAAAQQQHWRAATLFGLAEQVRSHMNYDLVGPLRSLVDAALATVRAALGNEGFAEAFASGLHFSLNDAFATLLILV